MRTQSISPLSHEQEWLAVPVDPSGWLTGRPAHRTSRVAGVDPADRFESGSTAQQAAGVLHDDEYPDAADGSSATKARPRRRMGRVDKAAELGGARVVSRRRRRRMHSKSRLERPVQRLDLAEESALDIDAEPTVDGYRMGRWARLALTLTVVAAAAVVIGMLAIGSAPQALVDVTVGPGDSLWSIASENAPDRDPRAVIEEIREINGINSEVLPIGVVLRVPAADE